MQEQDLVIAIQPHQLARGGDRLIDHSLEQGGSMSYFQNGQSRFIKIQDGATRLFENFLWQYTWTCIEIVNHVIVLK